MDRLKIYTAEILDGKRVKICDNLEKTTKIFNGSKLSEAGAYLKRRGLTILGYTFSPDKKYLIVCKGA